ncbi:bifunctional folylpolyglutamate synthase/dihydrofolate synthase [Thermus thermamylovorans]|uniref:tetrahydrofolate synthase n=1 Tax=Thermus thermamylovorans TaxID=2509362 RepID=A0A4Q9B2S3_9DEIN|nr:folylpolyglutamate synthase/dihydrofolate synthase family protein [Thermus thermamylovorans]TBH17579.1 bifunctional folylpolyglutamate synthase/dihydrofolate synthase [Thermus thermamylovorans]
MNPLAWLYARQGVMTLGLERIRALLRLLGDPQEAYPVALVGGTNGKGTAARALAAVLGEAGLRVGLYTSPHLVAFPERIAVGGNPIPEEGLLALLEEVRPHAERVGASFFEAATALALLHFAREGVEFAVLEVGLGGRLDATNAAEPRLSLVTNIGHDHLELLGPTLRDVAREKAGILRRGVPALTAARGEGLEELRAQAGRLGAPLWVLGEAFALAGVEAGPSGLAFRLRLGGEERAFQTPLLGPHQAENLALAAVGGRLLGAPWEAVARALLRVEHPGRLERLPWPGGKELLLDGAHNPEGAWALREALRFHRLLPAAFVLAFSREKDHAAMAEALGDLGPVVLTRYASPRSADPKALLPLFPGASVEEEPLKALERALALMDRVVVAGSLYLVGEVKRALLGLPPEERWQ